MENKKQTGILALPSLIGLGVLYGLIPWVVFYVLVLVSHEFVENIGGVNLILLVCYSLLIFLINKWCRKHNGHYLVNRELLILFLSALPVVLIITTFLTVALVITSQAEKINFNSQFYLILIVTYIIKIVVMGLPLFLMWLKIKRHDSQNQ